MRSCLLGYAAGGLLLLFGAAGAAWCQQGPAEIEGIVIDAASGSPIRKAYVRLLTDEEHPAEALAITDGAGRFAFANVPPGRYKLSAQSDGYRAAWFGAPTPHYAAGVITLHPGERRQDLILSLTMFGSISGTVLDQDGEPVGNVGLSLLIPWFPRGKPGFVQRSLAGTNDRGEYFFADLIPGRYLVMANARGMPAILAHPESFASAQPITEFPVHLLGLQFYPNADRVSDASLVTVAAGKRVEGIDFHLKAHATATLQGTVIPPGDFTLDAPIQVRAEQLGIPGQNGFMVGAPAPAPAYQFTLGRLMPGDYLVAAIASSGDREYRGVQRVTVNEGAENTVTLKMDAGIDLAGNVVVEGQKVAADARVLLLPGDGLPGYRERPEAHVKAEGSFVLQSVVPGVWDIDVKPIPEGGYVKSMRLGQQDVLTEDMVISRDTAERLDIVVSAHGGILEGDVKTESGDPAGPAHVLAAPDGKFGRVLSFYSLADADEKGHFRMKGLTPGHYKLYAFDSLNYCAWCDPDFLKPFADGGLPVDIREGANPSKKLRLIHNPEGQP